MIGQSYPAAKGVFAPTSSNGLNFMARQRQARAGRTLDRFAELLAQGVTPPDAAERLGLARRGGDTMLARIRRELGWQAK